MPDLTELRRQVLAAAAAEQPADVSGQESCPTCDARLRCPVQGCPHAPTRETWRHFIPGRCVGPWRCPVHNPPKPHRMPNKRLRPAAYPSGFGVYAQMVRARPSGTRRAARV